jgi:hypothetical protein
LTAIEKYGHLQWKRFQRALWLNYMPLDPNPCLSQEFTSTYFVWRLVFFLAQKTGRLDDGAILMHEKNILSAGSWRLPSWGKTLISFPTILKCVPNRPALLRRCLAINKIYSNIGMLILLIEKTSPIKLRFGST